MSSQRGERKKNRGTQPAGTGGHFQAQFTHAVTVGAALLRPASARILYVVPPHHEEHLDTGLSTLTPPLSTIHCTPHLFYSLDQFTLTRVPHFNTMLSCSIVMEIVRADLELLTPPCCLSWRRKPCPLLDLKYNCVFKG